MSITIIAAIGKNYELGKNGDLIWKLSGDLAFFKEKTTGRTIIMGDKTFESLGRPLPNRKHIVITLDQDWSYPEIEVSHDIEEIKNRYLNSAEEVFVIGGGQIYKQFIDAADKMYLTEIEATDEQADTYFPRFDKRAAIWQTQELAQVREKDITYRHMVYTRNNRRNGKR